MATTTDYTQKHHRRLRILKAQKTAVVYDATPAFDILGNALRLLETELQRSLTGPKQTRVPAIGIRVECGDYRVCSQKSCPAHVGLP
jgi:hypothetical protein